MKIIVLCVGTKMPEWVTAAVSTYQKRFPPEMKLVFTELAAAKRNGSGSEEQAKELEGKHLLQALPKKAYVIALDEHGVELTSEQLSVKVGSWQSLGMDVVLIVGGPNGLTAEVKNKASELWSLSKLTLPHPLVRVVLAETLYRAYSIYANLPYHRA